MIASYYILIKLHIYKLNIFFITFPVLFVNLEQQLIAHKWINQALWACVVLSSLFMWWGSKWLGFQFVSCCRFGLAQKRFSSASACSNLDTDIASVPMCWLSNACFIAFVFFLPKSFFLLFPLPSWFEARTTFEI
jgi:hypothetical protein